MKSKLFVRSSSLFALFCCFSNAFSMQLSQIQNGSYSNTSVPLILKHAEEYYSTHNSHFKTDPKDIINWAKTQPDWCKIQHEFNKMTGDINLISQIAEEKKGPNKVPDHIVRFINTIITGNFLAGFFGYLALELAENGEHWFMFPMPIIAPFILMFFYLKFGLLIA